LTGVGLIQQSTAANDGREIVRIAGEDAPEGEQAISMAVSAEFETLAQDVLPGGLQLVEFGIGKADLLGERGNVLLCKGERGSSKEGN